MNAIIVDDEHSNRMLLSSMLSKHCPEVNVVAAAGMADEAFDLILQFKPDLLFLDVKMPHKNGFDLLRRFGKIDFEIIFVTGFDEYAVKAFEFSAIAYILKPIDHVKLISAVKRVRPNHRSDPGNLIHFVHSLEEKNNYIQKITLHGKDKVNVIDIDDIVYIAADRGYCEILDVKNKKHVSAKPLGDFEELLEPVDRFVRVNKSFLININHVHSYTKGSECIINMKGCDVEIEVSRRKKTQILTMLKEK